VKASAIIIVSAVYKIFIVFPSLYKAYFAFFLPLDLIIIKRVALCVPLAVNHTTKKKIYNIYQLYTIAQGIHSRWQSHRTVGIAACATTTAPYPASHPHKPHRKAIPMLFQNGTTTSAICTIFNRKQHASAKFATPFPRYPTSLRVKKDTSVGNTDILRRSRRHR